MMNESVPNEPGSIRKSQFIMDRVRKYTQAYPQTPWRQQLRFIGLFLAGLVIFALIAGIYLNVSNRAILIGRQIRTDYAQIIRLEREIEDQQAQLAVLTSSVEIERRAEDLGFRPATSEEILYLMVPDYNGRQQVALAPESQAFVPSTPTLSPAFTQSLLEWAQSQLSLPSISLEDMEP